jgi:DNA-binding transcriptional ArsR family regulator
LADAAGVARSTASAHLSKLESAGFLVCVPQGRHRYYRLADEGVAEMLEQMLGIASRAGAMPLLTGPRDAVLREARVCYDHLAGRHAVALLERLLAAGIVVRSGAALSLGPGADEELESIGLDVAALKHTRHVPCRACLDWSERRDHLAGALGAALLQLALERGWVKRERDSRAVRFTPAGLSAFEAIGQSTDQHPVADELMRE